MRYLSICVLLLTIVLWSSCRKDFESDPSTGNLEFSSDTLLLDTIFTNIGSSTYQFKVYNRSKDDFTIPRIALERGENSNYRLNVDGIAGKTFENIQVLAKDSIFIFVETTTDIIEQTDTEFLYTDRVLFDPNGNQQDVDLITLVKDAVFLFPDKNNITGEVETIVLGTDADGTKSRIEGFFLEDKELTFTAEKPYVIYGFAAIPPNKTLTIDAGARIYFHENSGIIAENNSTLLVNGALSTDPVALENEVIFKSDRLESQYSEVSGQWGTIWLRNGSKGHKINHATIKNAIVGILVEGTNENGEPTLDIRNSQIYNSATVGLLCRSSNVYGENIVTNNSGQVALNCGLGGTYNFDHCTFANYFSSGSRDTPAVLIQNYLINPETNTIIPADLVEANFTNCIIYGNIGSELLLDKNDKAAFNYNFKNCLIKFDDKNLNPAIKELYDFTNINLYQNNIFNELPDFKRELDRFNNADVDLLRKSRNFMNIGEKSAANGKATAPGMGTDILGNPRNSEAPDIGAYESVILEQEDIN